MIKKQIDDDLKQAMLAGDKRLVSVLRGVKSTILDQEIAEGKRGSGISDEEVTKLLQKESKKRTEAAELYQNNQQAERAENEQYEKQIIDSYLPEQLSEDEVRQLVDKAVAELGEEPSMQHMGKLIAVVKEQAGGSADGAVIAKVVKEKISDEPATT